MKPADWLVPKGSISANVPGPPLPDQTAGILMQV